jgi:hypothetical protein
VKKRGDDHSCYRLREYANQPSWFSSLDFVSFSGPTTIIPLVSPHQADVRWVASLWSVIDASGFTGAQVSATRLGKLLSNGTVFSCTGRKEGWGLSHRGCQNMPRWMVLRCRLNYGRHFVGPVTTVKLPMKDITIEIGVPPQRDRV